MQWHSLQQPDDFHRLLQRSASIPCFIFKHSTRCSISSVALRRLERFSDLEELRAEWYLLDIIAHRDVSNEIADQLNVKHESPQLILIEDSQATWSTSHLNIYPQDIPDILSSSQKAS